MKQITTNKATYNKYVEQKLWKPKEKPQFFRAGSAKAKVDAKLKGKDEYVPAEILITDYFTKDQIQNR